MEPRSPNAQEYEHVLQFLDRTLRPDSGWSISNEYPTALNKDNLNNISIIKEGDRVVSHAVVRPIILKTPIGLFKVATIGSVVTESASRNQGLSKKIITDCIQKAQAQACDFAVLWTNLYDFYRPLGFELSGYEISLVFDKKLSDNSENLKFLKGPNIDPMALLKIMNAHGVVSMRTVEEVRKYLYIPNSRVYTAWSQQGQLEAYAVEGKGADLDGYIHEWGGGVSKLLPLLSYLQADQQRALNLISPIHSENLIKNLITSGATMHEGFLGMFRIINSNSFFSKILRHVRMDLGLADFILEESKGLYKIGTTKETLTTSNPLEMIQIIFGPKDVREILKFSNETAEVLNRVFPLKIWFWGWDSI